MKSTLPCIVLCLLVPRLAAQDFIGGESKDETGLQPHEPSFIGWRIDKGDASFIDVQVSVKYPIVPRYTDLWIALTARIGQYLDLDSAPVVSKRFNPELFWRRFSSGKDENRSYLDLTVYGHESNGQSVSDQAGFDALSSQIRDDSDIARKFVSRGWDYSGFTWKEREPLGIRNSDFFLRGRGFWPNGILQQGAENFHAFEGAKRFKRQEFGGISMMYRHSSESDNLLTATEFSLGYETGYAHPFRNHTFRGQLTLTGIGFPLTMWGQVGYNNDLASYFVYESSVGIVFYMR